MATDENIYISNLEFDLSIAVAMSHGDTVCAHYLFDNKERLIPVLVAKAEEHKLDVADFTASYVRGVHKRHQEFGCSNPQESK